MSLPGPSHQPHAVVSTKLQHVGEPDNVHKADLTRGQSTHFASIYQSSGRGVSGLKHRQHASAAPTMVVMAFHNRQSTEMHAECIVLAG